MFGDGVWEYSGVGGQKLCPLTDKKFEWTQECQIAFDTLKQRFTEEPVLMMPDQSRPYQIEADASKYASGVVLTQTDSNGD